MLVWIVVLLLSALVGVSLGLLGSGGSIFLVPLLVFVVGLEVGQAIPMSLAIVGLTSGLAAVVHGSRGNFHPRATLLLGVTGMIGALVGSQLTHLVPDAIVLMLFAVIMFASGATMLRRQTLQPRTHCRVWPCLGIGLFGGMLTGFLGGGGALVLIPGMVLLAGVPMQKAVGSSLALIALNAVAALVGHLQVTAIPWDTTAILAAATVVGMGGGTTLSLYVSETNVRRLFAWMIVLVAIAVAFRSATGM